MGETTRGCVSHDTVTIPTKLFKFLLSAMLAEMRFDEAAYREKNPDVAAAERNGEIKSLHEHFVGTGWFEGRSAGDYKIDEAWYLTTYRDLAVALRRGLISDLKKHFTETGRFEGRAASADQEKWRAKWDDALGINMKVDRTDGRV